RRGGLPDHEAGDDGDERLRRVRRRRRAGPHVPPGRHGRRLGLHGRTRRGAAPRRGGRPRGDGADRSAPRSSGRLRPRPSKTPPDGWPPYDPSDVRLEVQPDDAAGMIAYRLVDDIAERYLDLVDDVDAEIDELEDRVEQQSAEETRGRISELRHDMLRIRRTLAPMRDAVRRVVINVVEVTDGPQVFPHDVEVAF